MRSTLPASVFAAVPPTGPAALRPVLVLLAAERARLALWAPVAFGLGIGVYFALPEEPDAWPAALLLATCCAMAATLPGRLAQSGRILAMAAVVVALVAAGALCAKLRAESVAGPVLERRWGPAELTGRVISTEIRPDGRRLVLDRLEMPGFASERVPFRVRVKLPGEHGLPLPGQRVALRAQLLPPPLPVAPGAYDFARWAWFERIGGVGSARGAVRILPQGEVAEWRLALNAARTRLVAWVLAQDAGPAGQISAALLTGEMGHIQPDLMTAMRDSGLAHLLSISGLHITLVAGIVFFALRRGLALVPPLALRLPVKKVAAAGAMLAIAGYTLFAAPGVPTLRAWAMGSIVLVAVLVDRSPISIRLVAWAALAVMMITPEAMLGPSFQMSFAAVLALIALWEAAAPTLSRWRTRAGWGGRALVSLAGALLTTLAASAATAPFALYHFNRLSFYAALANLVAVPLTSVLVMPAAVLVFVLLPVGLGELPLAAMNFGNAVVAVVAREVAGLPGAAIPVPAMPDHGLVVTTLGGLWLALWRTRLRLLGMLAIGAGLATPWIGTQPDIRISGDARLIGLKLAPDRLALRGTGNVQMARETWLRRAGVEAAMPWPQGQGADGIACTAELCWIDRPGHAVALVTGPRGLAIACAHATVVVTTLDLWRDCPAPLRIVARDDILRGAGLEILLMPHGEAVVTTVAAARGTRLWAPAHSRTDVSQTVPAQPPAADRSPVQ